MEFLSFSGILFLLFKLAVSIGDKFFLVREILIFYLSQKCVLINVKVFVVVVIVVVTRPLPRDGGIARDYGASEAA